MDAMLELSRTGLGLVAVCDAQQQVQGVFTDGDLRRWLVGGGALTTPVNEAMTVGGTTLQSQSRAIDAKEILMKRKITAAPVVDENGKLTGAINLQDFYQPGYLILHSQTFRQPMQVGDVSSSIRAQAAQL